MQEKYNTNDSIITTSFYIGGMKMQKLKISEEAQVIFATYSMAAEALDIPELNTLFMVTPRREIEQAVGRILRQKNKNEPVVMDIVDSFSIFKGQYYKRRAFYKKSEFKMKSKE